MEEMKTDPPNENMLERRNTITAIEHSPEKTRLENFSLFGQGLGALATPLAIIFAIITLLVSNGQFNAQQVADQQKTQAQNQANLKQQQDQFQNLQDQQHQTTLDNYMDRMSDLIINQHLATSKPNDEVRVIARARTLRALSNVDPIRKGSIISFLWEAQLINGPNPIISLNLANLASADLQSSYLYDINLSGALVSYAKIQNSDLYGAILTNAHLDHVDFSDTTLDKANLNGADLSYDILSEASLNGAIYNSKEILMKDNVGKLATLDGKPVYIEPTQWPKGFNPHDMQLKCVDC